MWGYQRHFRVHQESAAERLFQKLDRRFKPELFLVGILDYGVDGRFPACVEPEEEYWIKSEDFNNVQTIANEIRPAFPEAQMLQSHPLAQERQDEDLLKRSIQDGILRMVESHPSRPAAFKFCVSYPAKIDCYWVSVALGLQTDVLDAYPALGQRSVKMHELRHISVAVSLIDAAASVFLRQATRELLGPDPGLGSEGRDSEELLRAAGDLLMSGLGWRIDQNCIEGMHGLFRSLTMASSLRYEKAAGKGRMILARKGHPAIKERVYLNSPVKLTAHRTVRKLLELASDELPLHCDPDHAYGIATQCAYNPTQEDLFTIEIRGHHHWELSHAGQVLMRVQYGLPAVPHLPFDEQKLRVDLRRIFRQISADDGERLIELVRTAERESHGTMLVITEAAQTEANRLASQGTPIKPLTLDPSTLRNLTPIDGAIVMDPAGVCYAIGTILDGQATNNGDPGRGARFNSALRYYESATAPCMIVVVSSDGGVDFIPNPMPMIRRAVIDAAIAILKEFAEASDIPRRRYRMTVDILDEHRFYLTEEDCNLLNPLLERMDSRIRSDDKAQLWIVRSLYTPNPTMTPALYYLG